MNVQHWKNSQQWIKKSREIIEKYDEEMKNEKQITSNDMHAPNCMLVNNKVHGQNGRCDMRPARIINLYIVTHARYAQKTIF